jgi:uncharacterized membrane protein (Fun14 family)
MVSNGSAIYCSRRLAPGWAQLNIFTNIRIVLNGLSLIDITWLAVHKIIQIDEKETLKATEHDIYENIAGSVWLSLFMGSNASAYYCPRLLAPG